MIVRTWVAYAKPGNARAYREHLKGSILPQLRKLDGFLGLSLCEAQRDNQVEILVISRWASLDAIKAFTGSKVDKAVIDPGTRAVLGEFDDFATHYEVTLDAGKS